MKYSFKLKRPSAKSDTAIIFSVFFKDEGKSLRYPTGKSIHPIDWNQLDRTVKRDAELSPQTSKQRANAIRRRLNFVSDTFDKIIATYETLGETYTLARVKKDLDLRLNRIPKKSTGFFDTYDEFLEVKKNSYGKEGVATSTYNRYRYIKKHLEGFQNYLDTKITFKTIDENFFNKFMEYCIKEKHLSANTLHRTVGFLLTFLNWAYRNRKTLNHKFIDFQRPSEQPTTDVALNLDQLSEIYKLDLSSNPKLERVRDLFIIGCTTGQRFSNYSQISEGDIVDNQIIVPDVKDPTKVLSIPLLPITENILKKYDFRLPVISNQKFNKYIKEVFEMADFNENTKRIRRYGKDIKEDNLPLYQRISSHTARRSFITIMTNQGVPIKVIMSITGHKSIKVFMQYVKVNEKTKMDKMQAVFKELT